jgi:ketosteroid isomerase-like protein
VVEVAVSGTHFLFLLDTGATSMLNLKSFSHGDPRRVSVTSWTGTKQTAAQQVTLGDFSVGRHHFKNLQLPAVDLSAIGQGCGRRIDGILGVDLLARLGATVDIKNRIAHIIADGQPPAKALTEPVAPDKASDTQADDARIAEVHQRLGDCEQAFNRGDEAAFADCLDPNVVIFTPNGDYYGRKAGMEYHHQRYFAHDPPAHLVSTARAHHAIGGAIWVEYDLRITLGTQVILARGAALCEKQDGTWRIVHMNHSAPPAESAQARKLE